MTLNDAWAEAGCMELSPRVAVVHFDCAADVGPVTAIKILQKAAECHATGVLDEQTQDAIAKYSDDEFIDRLVTHRTGHYFIESLRDASKKPKLHEWVHRLVALKNATKE